MRYSPILWPRGLRHEPSALIHRITVEIPLRERTLCLVCLVCVLYRYRARDKLITRPECHTICRKLIREPKEGGI